MWGLDISMERTTTVYTVGNKEYNCLCVEKEFVVNAVKEAGFCSVHMQSWGIESSGAKQYVTEKPGIRSHYFIHAKKKHFLITPTVV